MPKMNSRPHQRRSGPLPARFSGLAERAFSLRNVAKLSQEQLAARMGVGRPIVTHIESGRSKHIHAQTAVLLARALGTTVEYLVTGEQGAAE
jgi:transcriptional regulator with XRE-family HTH domain